MAHQTTPTTPPQHWDFIADVRLTGFTWGSLYADGSVSWHGFRFQSVPTAQAAALKAGY